MSPDVQPSVEPATFESFNAPDPNTGYRRRFLAVVPAAAVLSAIALYKFHGAGNGPLVCLATVACGTVACALLSNADADNASRLARGAAAALKAKDHVIAMIAHELRTPLAAVLASVALLQQQAHKCADSRCLSAIRRNAEFASRLLDDLLDTARLTHSKLTLRSEVLDIHELVQHVIDTARPTAARAGLKLIIALAAEEHFARADSVRLQQVISNLINNSIKFTPRGGQIQIRTENSPAKELCVQVADDGIGIDPHLLPRLFTPFEQGDCSVSRRFGGLGLGLSICKGIIELHGGTLSVASGGKGAGTVMTFTLATVAAPQTQARVCDEPTASPMQRPNSASPAPLRILLVEDHADTCRMMTRLLTNAGFSVHPTASVAQAVAAHKESRFDLLISDIALPDGDGLELMQTLARAKPLKGIAVSGHCRSEDMRRSRAAGFSAHLPKPIEIDHLVAVIAEVAAIVMESPARLAA